MPLWARFRRTDCILRRRQYRSREASRLQRPALPTPSKSATALAAIFSNVTVSIDPKSVTLDPGVFQRFSATVTGTSNTAIKWEVNGIVSGNSTVGTITLAGGYTAPSTRPTPPTVSVTARSVVDPGKAATAQVQIAAIQYFISPASLSLQRGLTQQFTVSSSAGGTPTVRWSVNGIVGGTPLVGTISPSGMYTAPSQVPNPPTVSVTATSVNDSSVTATAVVTIVNAIEVSITPQSADLQVGKVLVLHATVSGTSNTNVIWSVNGIPNGNSSVGTITSSGVYFAPPAVPVPSTLPITATSVADPTKNATAYVTVRFIQVTLSVTPSLLQAGDKLQITARVTGAGNGTRVNWAVNGIAGGNAAVGRVSATGVYTAPREVPTPPTVTVTAASVVDPEQFATATLTIVSSIRVTLSPHISRIQVGKTYQYLATITGGGDLAKLICTAQPCPPLTWSVNGIAGGNETVGTISQEGLFMAPGQVPKPATVSIRAISIADPRRSAQASVTVRSQSPTTLSFPRLLSVADLSMTGFAIVNPSSQAADLEAQLWSPSGILLSTVHQSIPAGGQVARLGSEWFPGNSGAGWIQAQSETEGLFGFWIGGDFVSTTDGAQPATPSSNQILPLVTDGTEIDIANPGTSSIHLTIRLISPAGTSLASAEIDIRSLGCFQVQSGSMFPERNITPGTYLLLQSASDFVATTVVSGYAGSHDTAVVNGIPITGTTQLNFPHLVTGQIGGANYLSMLDVVSTGGKYQRVTMTYFPDSSAAPITVTRVLSPGGTIQESASSIFGLKPDFQTGWVRLEGSEGVLGFIAYAETRSGGIAVVPAQEAPDSFLLFGHIADLPPWYTGLALLNGSQSDATVEVFAMTPAGSLIGGPSNSTQATLTLPARTKRSFLLSEVIPQTQSRTTDGGFIAVRSTNDVPIYGLELFFLRSGAVFSNVPATALSNGMTYLPPTAAPLAIGERRLNVTGLSTSAANPGDELVIYGSFDPDANLTVDFADIKGHHVQLAPLAVEIGALSVLVPPYPDVQRLGTSGGLASVAVTQKTDSNVTTSGAFSLQIGDLPQSGVAPGQITLDVLTQLSAQATRDNQLWTYIEGRTNQSFIGLDFTTLAARLTDMKTQIGGLASGATSRIDMGQIGDQDVFLDRNSLVLLDRIFAAYVPRQGTSSTIASTIAASDAGGDLVEEFHDSFDDMVTSEIPRTIHSNSNRLRSAVSALTALAVIATLPEEAGLVAVAVTGAVVWSATNWIAAELTSIYEGAGRSILEDRPTRIQDYKETIGVLVDGGVDLATDQMLDKIAGTSTAGQAAKATVQAVANTIEATQPDNPGSVSAKVMDHTPDVHNSPIPAPAHADSSCPGSMCSGLPPTFVTTSFPELKVDGQYTPVSIVIKGSNTDGIYYAYYDDDYHGRPHYRAIHIAEEEFSSSSGTFIDYSFGRCTPDGNQTTCLMFVKGLTPGTFKLTLVAWDECPNNDCANSDGEKIAYTSTSHDFIITIRADTPPPPILTLDPGPPPKAGGLYFYGSVVETYGSRAPFPVYNCTYSYSIDLQLNSFDLQQLVVQGGTVSGTFSYSLRSTCSGQPPSIPTAIGFGQPASLEFLPGGQAYLNLGSVLSVFPVDANGLRIIGYYKWPLVIFSGPGETSVNLYRDFSR